MAESPVSKHNGSHNHAKAVLRSIASDETYSMALRLQSIDELSAIDGIYSTPKTAIAEGAVPTKNGRKVIISLLRKLRKCAEGNEGISRSVKLRLACIAIGMGHSRWVVPGPTLVRAKKAESRAVEQADTMSLLERVQALKQKHGIGEDTAVIGTNGGKMTRPEILALSHEADEALKAFRELSEVETTEAIKLREELLAKYNELSELYVQAQLTAFNEEMAALELKPVGEGK